MPFAVIGSNALVDKGAGRKARARVYPWGTVDSTYRKSDFFCSLSFFLARIYVMIMMLMIFAVENLEHNDFLALRTMLIRCDDVFFELHSISQTFNIRR